MNENILNGMLYAFAISNTFELRLDGMVNPVPVVFKDNSVLRFAINRGIASSKGNLTVTLYPDEQCNLFDIAKSWLTEEQYIKIESLGFDFEYAEIRVNFQDLVSIADALGEIDINLCKKYWLDIYFTS